MSVETGDRVVLAEGPTIIGTVEHVTSWGAPEGARVLWDDGEKSMTWCDDLVVANRPSAPAASTSGLEAR